MSSTSYPQVAGFFVQGIHAWIAWLKYFSFIYYGYNLLQKIQFHDTPLYDCGAAGAVSSPQNHPDICTRLEDPSAALNLQVGKQNTFIRELLRSYRYMITVIQVKAWRILFTKSSLESYISTTYQLDRRIRCYFEKLEQPD